MDHIDSEAGRAADGARLLTLAEPGRLELIDSNNEAYTGGSQEWYEDRWHRMSGCGPVAASNLIWYMTGAKGGIALYLELMREMYTFVTPGRYGVNTSAIFTDGISRYCIKGALNYIPQALDIPSPLRKRPNRDTVRAFIATALQGDSPVAFLNLSNGSLDNLEAWHWVTIITFDTETMRTGICDNGKILEIDISAWLGTSILGGAFVYLNY